MRLEVMYAKNEKKRKICRACVCATRWKERLSPPRKLLSWQRELNVAHTSLFKRPDRSCIVPLFRSHESPTNINWLLIGAQISVNGTCVLNHSFFFLLSFIKYRVLATQRKSANRGEIAYRFEIRGIKNPFLFYRFFFFSDEKRVQFIFYEFYS